jgi:hypothetical protein
VSMTWWRKITLHLWMHPLHHLYIRKWCQPVIRSTQGGMLSPARDTRL